MRTLHGAYRRHLRHKRLRGLDWRPCAMVRDDALMTPLRPHTKHYPEDARKQLGLAVTRARQAAGYPYRPAFARDTGISVRSIVKLEQGDPVGADVYEAAARVLPGWNEDTPKAVLEGAEPPAPPGIEAENRPLTPKPEPDDEGWTDEDEELMESVRELARKARVKRLRPRVVQALLEEIARDMAERDQGDQSG